MPKPQRSETRAEETIAPSEWGRVEDVVGLAVTVPDAPPPPPPPPPVNEPPAETARTHFTPNELAKLTGNATERKATMRLGGGKPATAFAYSWQHAAAAQLHGWPAHEHHTGAPMQLTVADYLAALKASEGPVTRVIAKDGSVGASLDAAAVTQLNGSKPVRCIYEPHKPALSVHCPHASKEV